MQALTKCFWFPSIANKNLVAKVENAKLKKKGKLEDLDKLIILEILSYLDYKQVNYFGRSSKLFLSLARSNTVWKSLALRRWPAINIVIDNYYSFYRRRQRALAASKHKSVPIENCIEWEFKCPVALDKIQRTEDSNVDFCTSCNKHVYIVHNMEQALKRAKAKQCIAVDFDENIALSRHQHTRKMGVMIY